MIHKLIPQRKMKRSAEKVVGRKWWKSGERRKKTSSFSPWPRKTGTSFLNFDPFFFFFFFSTDEHLKALILQLKTKIKLSKLCPWTEGMNLDQIAHPAFLWTRAQHKVKQLLLEKTLFQVVIKNQNRDREKRRKSSSPPKIIFWAGIPPCISSSNIFQTTAR